MKSVALVGYSGHALVVADTFLAMGISLTGYFEQLRKENNPFQLPFLGYEGEEERLKILNKKNSCFFACIGNNSLRSKITEFLLEKGFRTLIAIHPGSLVSDYASVGEGSFVGPGSRVNALAKVGKGVILNTGSIIEHECNIGDFVHIAPGAVLAGNVFVGRNSFVGANSVLKEGITIGNNVTIGAGSVILKNVPDNETWVGNPGKKMKNNAK